MICHLCNGSGRKRMNGETVWGLHPQGRIKGCKYRIYSKSTSKANKNIRRQGIIEKILYFCNRIEATLSETYDKKKKRYAYLVSWKRRKFRTWYKRWHSGFHAIAWAAIIISVPKVSYDLQLRRGSIAVPRSCIL